MATTADNFQFWFTDAFNNNLTFPYPFFPKIEGNLDQLIICRYHFYGYSGDLQEGHWCHYCCMRYVELTFARLIVINRGLPLMLIPLEKSLA